MTNETCITIGESLAWLPLGSAVVCCARMTERVVAIMQARSGSSRLPGKSLEEVYPGLTLLGAIAERVKRTPGIAHFVVAPTSDSLDDRLADHARALGWQCVRGHATDVLARFPQAAQESDAGVIVRVTAD